MMHLIRCKHCKKVIGEMEILRDHWTDEHPEELREINKWLGKVEDKAKSWERWKSEVENGPWAEKH